MVVRIPTIDVGGQIGQGLGQAGAGFAENMYLKSQLEGLQNELRDTPSRTGIDLYNMLNQRLGNTPKGRALADKLFPILQESAAQMPMPQQERPGMTSQGFTGGAQPVPVTGETTEQPLVSPLAPPPPQGVAQEQVRQDNAVLPETKKARPSFDDLVYEPESLVTGDRGDLKEYYSAPPVLDQARRQSRVQELLSSGRAKTVESANAIAEKEFESDLSEFNRKRDQFNQQEVRLNDTLSQFTPRFESVAGDLYGGTDEEFANGSRLIAQYYALQEDANGNPVHSPREAAELAMKDVRQMSNVLKKVQAINPLSLPEVSSENIKKRKFDALKPAVAMAKKYGMQDYLRNQIVANHILSPSEASAQLFKPSKELIKGIDSIKRRKPKSFNEWIDVGQGGILSADQDQISQAAEVIKNIDPNQSLVVVRALLHDKGFDEGSFNSAYEQAIESGWEPSRFQEREYLNHLGRPVRYSLSDYWSGKTRGFRDFLNNYIFREKN